MVGANVQCADIVDTNRPFVNTVTGPATCVVRSGTSPPSALRFLLEKTPESVPLMCCTSSSRGFHIFFKIMNDGNTDAELAGSRLTLHDRAVTQTVGVIDAG